MSPVAAPIAISPKQLWRHKRSGSELDIVAVDTDGEIEVSNRSAYPHGQPTVGYMFASALRADYEPVSGPGVAPAAG